jgi:hypothetical protein
MRRKTILLGLGLLLPLGGMGAALFFLAEREPEFYRDSTLPAGKERTKKSGEFLGTFNDLYQSITTDRVWQASFHEKSINSFFEEQFVPSGLAEKVLPEGFTEPRLAIEPDKIRLAFRYQAGPLSTVISIDLGIWLTKEPNVVALELKGLHAGALPISAQSLLDRISETARQNNLEVTWYRYRGNPVALLRFQADQERPTYRLDRLVLHKGQIVIHGRSIEPPTLRAMLPLATQRASAN